jgi:carbohydrate kinase (thermoresistant glucokinase family)
MAKPQSATPSKIVVMGVSGCGKSTIGAALAERLGLVFTDGDDLHPAANVAKMAAGTPLTDADRWPWLDSVAAVLQQRGGVVACSALRRSYRDRILQNAPDTVFVHLAGTRELLQERISGRADHFMPSALLDSQLETLEALAGEEPGAVFDIAASEHEIVAEVINWLDSPGVKAEN